MCFTFFDLSKIVDSHVILETLVHIIPCRRVGATPLSTKRLPALRLNIEAAFPSYGDFHVEYKTVTGPSYFNTGITILVWRHFVLKWPSGSLLTCKHRWKYYLVSIGNYATAIVKRDHIFCLRHLFLVVSLETTILTMFAKEMPITTYFICNIGRTTLVSESHRKW